MVIRGTVRSLGKNVTLNDKDLLAAFEKSDEFLKYKRGQDINVAAQEFATKFTKNFVFKEDDAHTKIALSIRESVRESK